MADHGVRNTTCTVYFRDNHGQLHGHVTSGSSLFEVCRKALNWFNDPIWKGARPHRETILEVSAVSGGATWHVTAGIVMDWAVQLADSRQ